jgi:hypothetical protein
MKKVLLSMLVLVVLACGIVLVSCNDDTNEQSTATTTTTTTPTIEYCKHDDPEKIVVVEEKTPTCQETGLTEGMKCLNCETMVVPQRIIETIDCIESDWIVDLESTKIEDGKRHTECTMCGVILKEQIIVAGSQGLGFGGYFADDGEYAYVLTSIGTCTDTDIVIPRSYEGSPVTDIGTYAFRGSSTLKSVIIPDSVTGIGSDAFKWCASLEIIIIPNSVTSICSSAFSGCTSLTSITIPDSVTSIGWRPFEGCTSLTSIYFEGTVEEWNAMDGDKGYWNNDVPATEIICSNGTVPLN